MAAAASVGGARDAWGSGIGWLDYDNDGDLDILECACGQAPRLLRNESAKGPHWGRLTLKGTTSNRDAIGAEVTLVVGGKKQTRLVMPTRSDQSQWEKYFWKLNYLYW